jgi:hypothetical protein
VPHRQLAFLKQFSDRRWQLEHAKHVRDRRPILTYGFGDLLLCETEFVGEPMVALPFFDWIEISALKILDESQRQDGFIVDVLYDRGNFFPPEFRRCAEATFTGNQFETVLSRTSSNGYRLKESAGLEAFFEFLKLVWIEFCSRLKGISSNLSDRYRFQSAIVARGQPSASAEERFEPPSQPSWRFLSGHHFLLALFCR